jgi:hypothetical protein
METIEELRAVIANVLAERKPNPKRKYAWSLDKRQNAIRDMLRMGADLEDIAALCGVERAELVEYIESRGL